ncbi:unnamed protein product [Protopolystoma xenopodis]|uniref:Uncharacterized protein n=1 Tax=Protopolystoma xenopodis TaxID=117903 RepID=A0A3S5CHE7_9PLAT|nr:unnamed protein product [Protopolystoma xenopodis]
MLPTQAVFAHFCHSISKAACHLPTQPSSLRHTLTTIVDQRLTGKKSYWLPSTRVPFIFAYSLFSIQLTHFCHLHIKSVLWRIRIRLLSSRPVSSFRLITYADNSCISDLMSALANCSEPLGAYSNLAPHRIAVEAACAGTTIMSCPCRQAGL